jgi:hypothetical protein
MLDIPLGESSLFRQNCAVTVVYLQSWAQPEIGSVGLQWIKYGVNGMGTQTLDINDLS